MAPDPVEHLGGRHGLHRPPRKQVLLPASSLLHAGLHYGIVLYNTDGSGEAIILTQSANLPAPANGSYVGKARDFANTYLR